MSDLRIVVTGEDQVARALAGLGSDVENPRAMQDIASQAVSALSAASPRRSGRLAASWRPTVTQGRAAAESVVAYAGPVTYGWPKRNIEAARINERADQAIEPSAVQALENDINDSIRRRGLT